MEQWQEKVEYLVKKYEGCSLSAYLCPAGIWTIGYGHTGRGITKDRIISIEQANYFLEQDIALAAKTVTRLIPRKLTANQYAALCSFVFNLGAARLQRSSLRQKCNRGEDALVPKEFIKWVYGTVKGVPTKLPGLIKRRAEEAALYKAL